MHSLPDDPDAPPTPAAFRLGFVPGVNPAKWVSIWRARRPEALELVPVNALDDGATLRAGEVEAALLRLPIDRTGLEVIPLYEEVPVVLLPVDHLLTVLDEVTGDDLTEEIVLRPLDDLMLGKDVFGLPARDRPATTKDAVALVAAGIGLLVTPMSLARLHRRKDVTFRPVVDGPTSGISLVWARDRTTERVEEFIGIVRGRTVNSSRGRPVAAEGGSGEKGATEKGEPPGKQHSAAPQRPGADRGGRARATPTGRKPARGRKPKPGRGKGKR